MLSLNKWYGAAEARIAEWLPATEVWDTSVNVPNLQGIKLTPRMDNDEARAFGVFEDGLSVVTGLELTLDFSHIDITSSNVMMGLSSDSSGSGSSETRTIKTRGRLALPYFGLIVKVLADDGRDAHILVPKVKLDTALPFEFTGENKFVVPSVGAKGFRLRLNDGTLYELYATLEHATAASVATDFNTAMADLVIS